jgi:hypothetical protein
MCGNSLNTDLGGAAAPPAESGEAAKQALHFPPKQSKEALQPKHVL